MADDGFEVVGTRRLQDRGIGYTVRRSFPNNPMIERRQRR